MRKGTKPRVSHTTVNIILFWDNPFSGSETGRRARAIEIDPGYVDVAIRRWEHYTGKSARLAPLGETFEEIAESRAVSSAEKAEVGA